MQHLFTPDFLASINRFSLTVAQASAAVMPGAHLSRAAGSSLEFRDYQPYSPGDDLRRVDWNVYGRTRHLFVRQFERPTAVPVHVLVDGSESMHLESPSRYATAARAAAAVASAALAGQSPVHLSISDAPARTINSRRRLATVLSELSANHSASVGIADAIDASVRSMSRKSAGVMIIISDFFEPFGIDTLIASLRRVPHRLILLQITQPKDADPDLAGNLQLSDCDSPIRLDVQVDEPLRQRYRSAYRLYFDELQRFALGRGARLLRFDASSETLPQLEPLFPSGVLSV